MAAPLDPSPSPGMFVNAAPLPLAGLPFATLPTKHQISDEAFQKARVLIVDDEESVANLVKFHLNRAGFENCDIVTDCRLALTRIKESIPDLVLLDIRMKPIHGWQILEQLRQDERTEHIAVIILTSETDEKVRSISLHLGANDFLNKPIAETELVARVSNTLSTKIYRDMMTSYSLQLESDVLRDGLTGVFNRRAFDYELKRRIVEWNRQRIPLGLVLIDIDHFKATNDRYGHQVGDACLRAVASRLAIDVREMDLVARYGGEEFAIILPYATPREAKHAAERVRLAIACQPIVTDEQELNLTVSIGLANAMHGDDADLLVRRVDTALYAAKRNGRNRSYYHNGGGCEQITPAEEQADRCPVGKLHQQSAVTRSLEQAKIVIVDDEPQIIALVRKYLKDAGYQNFVSISDPTLALTSIREESPDLLLLDIRMPKISGLDILKALRAEPTDNPVPVLIFTSATDKETKVEAIRLGANDYLEKPLHVSELLARVRSALLAKAHLDFLSEYSQRLEHEVRIRTSELAASRREAIQCLARAAELRDDTTGQHVLRVGRYAAILAKELGFGEERISWLELAAQLHDVGKIGIPDSILKKPGPLTVDEYETMKQHCGRGSRIIRDEACYVEPTQLTHLTSDELESFNSPLMTMAAIIAESHHEKWDGSGYPRGLKGEAIPIEGRITAIADVFDALSTKRPYKAAMPLDQCFSILAASRGTHFDPNVLDAFFRCKSEICRTYAEYAAVD